MVQALKHAQENEDVGSPKILITHAWSNNIGDAAILTAISGLLRDVSPSAEISACVSHPESTRRICPAIDAKLVHWPWPVPQEENARPNPHPAGYPLIFAGNIVSSIAFRLFKARLFLFNRAYRKEVERFFDCDIMVSTGGGFIMPEYQPMTSYGEILMARILGKRIVLLAQTIGPFQGALQRAFGRIFLGMTDLIIVRESASAAHLKAIGLETLVTADTAFLLPVPVSRKIEPVVAICAKKPGRGDFEGQARAIAGLAQMMAKETGCSIRMMATEKDDVGFCRKVASLSCADGLDVESVQDVLPPFETAEALGRAQFLLTWRMHAAILGAMSGTPFHVIGRGHKFRGVLDGLCPGCVSLAGELDDIRIAEVMDGLSRHSSRRMSILKSLPSLRRKAARNKSILAGKFAEYGVFPS